MSRLTNLSRLQVIVLHSVLWICFLFFPLLIYRIDFFNAQFFNRDLINNAFLILLFYLNFYYLLPKYFNGKKITAYFAIVVGCIIVFTLQQLCVEYYFMHSKNGKPFFTPGFEMHKNLAFDSMHLRMNAVPSDKENHLGPPRPIMGDGKSFFSMPPFFWIEGIRRSLSAILTILLAGSFIRVALQWFHTEKQKEELQIQRLNDELGLLKAQINPHFLFNSLNTVYSLARKKSQNTEAFILKLSEILRYVLYEAAEQKVLLSSELTYIENYIDLQQYRIDKNMQIKYTCNCNAGSLHIEPMLLITFVENAFKHGISYREGSFIAVAVTLDNNWLYLYVSNSYNKQQVKSEYSGIGLNNVKKRLQLSYPDLHELVLKDENETYTVNLKIKLS